MLKVETGCFGSKKERNIQLSLWRTDELTRRGYILSAILKKKSKRKFQGQKRCAQRNEVEAMRVYLFENHSSPYS